MFCVQDRFLLGVNRDNHASNLDQRVESDACEENFGTNGIRRRDHGRTADEHFRRPAQMEDVFLDCEDGCLRRSSQGINRRSRCEVLPHVSMLTRPYRVVNSPRSDDSLRAMQHS